MTLPQQNTASARPTSFYYLMCQLDRVQYPRLQHAFKLYQGGMSDVDVARNTGIKRTTFIRYRKKYGIRGNRERPFS